LSLERLLNSFLNAFPLRSVHWSRSTFTAISCPALSFPWLIVSHWYDKHDPSKKHFYYKTITCTFHFCYTLLSSFQIVNRSRFSRYINFATCLRACSAGLQLF
jgi:hypothetical protein